MKRTFFASILALAAALAAHAPQALAQRTGAAKAATPSASAELALPASDGVVLVELRRLLTQALPNAAGDNKERLAQINSDIERFKARTGLDARDFDTLAVAARAVRLDSGATKIDNVVAVATGRFRPEAVAAAARSAAGGAVAEQKHGGKTLLVFGVNDTLKVFGLVKMRVGELALAVLDANTLAVGDPAAVRSAVDAQAGRGRIDPALPALARNGGGDLVSFAGNVPPFAFAGVDVGLPEVNRSIESIRGFYGGLGTTRAGYQLTTVLRTTSAADARQLSNTVTAVRAIAPGLLSTAGEKARFARSALDNLKITVQGNDVSLRTELSQPDAAALIRAL